MEAARLGLIAPILVGPRERIEAVAAAARDRHRRRARSSMRRTARRPPTTAVRAGARRQGRGADEGQPAHRRADGRRGQARHRPAHRAAHQPLLRDGRARPRRRADHHRRRGQHRADARRQGRHRAERDRPRARAGRRPRCGSRSSRRWRPSTRRCLRPSRPRRCARWWTGTRSPARILDGPLALDNAINLEAAKIKKIDSPVAGRANVLMVPDLEAGNMLAKSLLPGGRRCRGHRARRAGADHPDQPRRFGH